MRFAGLAVAAGITLAAGLTHAQGGGRAVMLNLLPPAPVPGLGPAATVATGIWTSCAVVKGEVWCWGEMGVFGGNAPDRHVPRKTAGLRDVTQLSVSQTGACARTAAGHVLCWGRGFGGRTPRRVPGLPAATKVSAGSSFACALTQDGHVACWGDNDAGQLGQEPGGPAPASGPTPARAAPKPRAQARKPGMRVLEAILAGPGVPGSPFGADAGGPGADEPAAPRPAASLRALVVPALDEVVDLAAGDRHACAVRRTGEVICWGDRDIERPRSPFELAGRPRAPDEPRTTTVIRTGAQHRIPKLDDAVAVSAGDRTSCALRRGGRVSCWNEYAHRRPLVGPHECTGLDDAVALADHARYAVRATGDVVPVASGSCYQPRPVAGVADVVEVSSHCARRRDGTIVCWGTNEHGELGRPRAPFYLK
ncbi:MAG TPA: hypothetical protein VGQ83_26465 [Polyangia bacterium]